MKAIFTKIVTAIISIVMLTSYLAQAETIYSIQDGNWNVGNTWVGGNIPTSTDSVVVSHAVKIIDGDSCTHLYVASSGDLRNLTGNTRTLVILGNLWMDGEVGYTNYYFDIRLGGNLHLNGTWNDVRLYFIGTLEQTVSATPGKVFSATRTGILFEDDDPASAVKFTTDLTFISTELIGNGSTVEFVSGIEVTFDAEPIRSMNITGNNSTLTMQNGAFIEYSSFDNLTFDGVVILGNDNSSTGELINAGIMKNLSGGYRTLTVNGNFTNDGIVTMGSSYILHFIFFGNISNTGEWVCGNIYFDGTVDQHIVSSPGKYIYCDLLQDRDVSSKIILDGDLEIRNATINLDYGILDANGFTIILRNAAYFENSFINQASLGGRFRCYYNCEFTGTTIIVDTLENRPVSSNYSLTVQGNLINNGVIRRSNSYAYKLFIHDDFENNGPVDLEDLTFAGINDQAIYSTVKGGMLDIDQVYDTLATSAIIFNSDLTFIGSNWDLGGATINLNNGAFLMQGGSLKNGSLISNNQYLQQRGGAAILSMHLSNVELRGVCQLDDHYSIFTNVINTDTLRNEPNFNQQVRLSTYGTFTNNGVINRSDSYGIRLFVHDDFVNNGPIDIEDLVFAGINDQTIYSTSKGGIIDVDQVVDTVAESAIIFNSDMTFQGSTWDLDGATINLNSGGLIMQGGTLGNGFLISNNQYLRQSGNAGISNMHFSDVELKGICLLNSTENYFTNVTVTDTLMNHPNFNNYPVLFIEGDIVNNGVMTNSDAYNINMQVNGNFYNNGKANFTKLVFTGDDIQHFTSPVFPITDSPIESTKTGGHVQCDADILLSGCTVQFSWDVFNLQNGNLMVTGGNLQNIGIEGNGFKLIAAGNAVASNVVIEDLTIEGHLYAGGTDITFENVTISGTISQWSGHNNDSQITTIGDFVNNGHIIDIDTYGILFHVQDVVINNGEWTCEGLIFEGDDMHFIESLAANPFEVENITISAMAGDVTISNELYLLNTNLNLSSKNLYIPDAGTLDIDNSSIQFAMVNGNDFPTINCSNNSWLSGSTFNSVIISGAVDTRANTFVDCVLDAVMQNDNVPPDAVIAFEGVFTNNGSMINRPAYSYELFSNVIGHVYNYGTWEIEKSNWQGIIDQDIYLMEGSEINTPSEFNAMLGTEGYQWYKNDEVIDGATTNNLDFTAITAADRGYYHCETNEGSSRIIRICTPLDVDLAAEAWFCQYESVMLEPEITFGEPPYTYSWSPVEGLSDPNIQNPLANPEEPTVYTVTITDAIGCVGESNIFVQQYPVLNASAGNDKEICFGQTTVLEGSASGGAPDYTYSWNPETGLSNPNIATPIATPENTTLYTLTVTDANGCQETTSVNVIVNPLPVAFGLSQDSTHFCYEQDTIICWLLDSELGVEYELYVNGSPNPGGEVFAGTGEAIPIWAITTIQGHYELRGTNTTTLCENMMTGSVMIFIDFLPEVVDQSGDEILMEGESTTLWVEVTSTQPPWLQWYKDGVIVPGAQDYNLVLDNLSIDATGNYQCLVTNNCDIAWSNPVSITVLQRQTIEIPAGWSGFSTYQNVYDADVNNMFEQLGGNLVIVSDFENVFWPGGSVNTYGDWNTKVGAQIKLSESASLNVDGLLPDDRTINLEAGWNYLPVLGNCNFDASAIFDQLGASLELAKDIAGTRVYWPEFNIQTLNTLEPGKAYLMKLSSASSITFPDCLKGDQIAPSSKRAANGSPFTDPAYTGISHLIVIPELACKSILQSGDWIGVFNQNGVCAGLSEYKNGNMVITAFADDPTTFDNDGLDENEAFKLMAYRKITGQYLELNPNYSTDYDDGYFVANGLSVTDHLKATAVKNDLDGSEISIFPNPAREVININGLQARVSWELINSAGELLKFGVADENGKIYPGNLTCGLYTLKLVLDNEVVCRKVIFR